MSLPTLQPDRCLEEAERLRSPSVHPGPAVHDPPVSAIEIRLCGGVVVPVVVFASCVRGHHKFVLPLKAPPHLGRRHLVTVVFSDLLPNRLGMAAENVSEENLLDIRVREPGVHALPHSRRPFCCLDILRPAPFEVAQQLLIVGGRQHFEADLVIRLAKLFVAVIVVIVHSGCLAIAQPVFWAEDVVPCVILRGNERLVLAVRVLLPRVLDVGGGLVLFVEPAWMPQLDIVLREARRAQLDPDGARAVGGGRGDRERARAAELRPNVALVRVVVEEAEQLEPVAETACQTDSEPGRRC